MKKLFSKYKYHFGIFFVVGMLFFTNYKPGTFLTGWDNLQTDLYPVLAVKRAVFSVWEEYQSFGLVAGMAHSADLIRAIFVWIISFILPQNIIRYFFHFFMVFIGALGTFKLLLMTITREDEKESNNHKYAFIGSLFYILNFGTIQYFFFPYEPFSYFFAFLPWLIVSMLRLSNQFNRRSLFLFFLVNLLATPSFYVQTIFFVYMFIFFAFSIFYIIRSNQVIKTSIIKLLILLFIIFSINSFWILPQIYFLKTARFNPEEAKINQLSTNVVIDENKTRGTFTDFLTYKGFYFDLKDKLGAPYFSNWKDYFNNPFVKLIQITFIVIVALGIISKNKYKGFFAGLLFITALFLLSNTPFFSQFNEIIRKNNLINQIFRAPFTKFIALYVLVSSFFFTLGVKKLSNKFNLIFITILIFFLAFPAFSGNYISPIMRVKIPDEYLQLFSYFKQVDTNKRIALLPDYTYWGWFYQKWGYDGSGFLWYGIEQPIVSRTFDVWSEKSEGYFWEIRQAIMRNDITSFNTVLKKYNIHYLLLDQSILPIATQTKALNVNAVNQLLEGNSNLVQVFANGYLKLYEVENNQDINFLNITADLPNIGPEIGLTNEDTAFTQNLDYQTDKNNNYSLYYPFLELQTFNQAKKNQWTITDNQDEMIINEPIPNDVLSNLTLNSVNNSIDTLFSINGEIKKNSIITNVQVTNKQLAIHIDKVNVLPSNFTLNTSNACQTNSNSNVNFVNNNTLQINSSDGHQVCFGYDFGYLAQKYGYLIKIESKNISGDPLYFYLVDQTNQQSIIEDRLRKDITYFVVPPTYKYNLGYSLNFINSSYQNRESQNELNSIDIYPIPYEFLKGIKFINAQIPTSMQQNSIPVNSNQINYSLYTVDTSGYSNNQQTLVLSQAYSDGWKAYYIPSFNLLTNYLPFFFGQEINDHILVNNWKNGWRLRQNFGGPKGNNIVILFWPQYLEFIGFGLLCIGALFILLL